METKKAQDLGYLLEVVTAGKLKISVPGCVFPGKKKDNIVFM